MYLPRISRAFITSRNSTLKLPFDVVEFENAVRVYDCIDAFAIDVTRRSLVIHLFLVQHIEMNDARQLLSSSSVFETQDRIKSIREKDKRLGHGAESAINASGQVI